MEINKKFQSGFCNCFNVIGLPNYFNFPKHYMYVKNISLLKIHSFKNSYFLVFKLFDGDCVRADSVLESSVNAVKPSIHGVLALNIVRHGSLSAYTIQHFNVHRNVG